VATSNSMMVKPFSRLVPALRGKILGRLMTPSL